MKLMAHDIIVRPIITEKSSRMMEDNKYTFEVHPQANKTEVRKAVETVFKVKVEKVHTLKVRSKPKRMGVFLGKSRAWKKAIVTLAEGERIEFFEGASV
ncbi:MULTISPECIES: 50S ribosomal protein L23 [Dethiosulfovibrio]|uniref:Large ribosomal subunit protein uL23 n=3 Tax=Dethiosulfovibrio TaxID=47054 RepID=D2Z915_9BACT|nr:MULTISPECIES: 50S ribosomal protein L23 [Dethiosulfovibrio]MEA3285490.1 50S ribosomal protein L23 [Synergistota bacterium]EFC91962.1 Ribosomal protein L25/L23 [Dethiosulfovibrio peptidovorans DSM 11002]MCF4113008.1 50S ribosomal protein L23 [Dethiosulfovibrio russensis]MCF4141472.1 50S ribosomal protein L23 [Dethiosulfovibrio marinus]MCF4144428.1 50S ribosomal protein L23 [Dethiosulfovibrio acidaminovorans]